MVGKDVVDNNPEIIYTVRDIKCGLVSVKYDFLGV